MHYWIDGYNLLFRHPSSLRSLEEKRKSLIRQLNSLAKALHLQICVVFDNQAQEELERKSHYDHLEIVFTSRGKSADDFFVELAETSPCPKNLCIVTSDQELSRKIRALGSKTLSLSEFYDFISKKSQKKYVTQPLEYTPSKQEIQRLQTIFEQRLLENGENNF